MGLQGEGSHNNWGISTSKFNTKRYLCIKVTKVSYNYSKMDIKLCSRQKRPERLLLFVLYTSLGTHGDQTVLCHVSMAVNSLIRLGLALFAQYMWHLSRYHCSCLVNDSLHSHMRMVILAGYQSCRCIVQFICI